MYFSSKSAILIIKYIYIYFIYIITYAPKQRTTIRNDKIAAAKK